MDIARLKQSLTDSISENGCIPFWSWNDRLEIPELEKQIQWLKENSAGGFFMHARGGLKTEYLGKEWMDCVRTCIRKGKELKLKAWIYDENGWPSGFAGGKLLSEETNRDCFLTCSEGEPDESADFCIKSRCIEGKYLNISVHRAASTADILNPEVVDKFIEETHEKYKNTLGEDFKSVAGFFTDEPQYYRWNTPFTYMLDMYFTEHYGESVFENIGLLFEDGEGYREYRYRYYLALHTLMLNSFAKKLYDKCEEYKLSFTGHYIEENSLAGQMLCCGGVMPFYALEHMPGIDWLARSMGNELALRQISSVAAQTGKRKLLSETFGCCGWDITPTELKAIAEFQFVGGINVMCQHLVPYSEHGQRKRDYPAHFSRINPFVREGDYFKRFNGYFANVGKLISDSEEAVNVAILHPIRSAYLEYKRYINPFDGGNIDSIEKGLRNTMQKLKSNGIQYHFVDETMLAEMGEINEGRLACGKCEYDFLVLPEGITNVSESTYRLLKKYLSQGGKLSAEGSPAYVEGREADFDFLVSNVGIAELRKAQICLPDIADTRLHYCVRRLEKDYFIYLQNTDSENSLHFSFALPEGYRSFEQVDLDGLTLKTVPTEMTVEPYGSRILFFGKKEPQEITTKKTVCLDKTPLEVVKTSENYLTVDSLSYSTDGINYSEGLNHMGVFKKLLTERYEGKLWLKYSFNVKVLPEKISIIAETDSAKRAALNGSSLDFTPNVWDDCSFSRADCTELVRLGENELITELDYFQSEGVYYALFGENVTESLRNCLAYDSEIEPVYVAGDFGVYSETGLTEGSNPAVLLGDNFYIGERKRLITETVSDGYPFFAGKMRLKGSLTLEDTDAALRLKGRYQAARVYLNGNYAGELFTSDTLDISKYAVKGRNEVEIEALISNRNLFGPHHEANNEEPFGVGPGSFELSEWEEGKSPRCLSRFALVKTKLFKG